MTEKEFWEIADNWYARTIRLAEIWQLEETTPERKLKAFNLWQVMTMRILKIKDKAVEMRTPKKPHNFKPGGVIYRKDSNSPFSGEDILAFRRYS